MEQLHPVGEVSLQWAALGARRVDLVPARPARSGAMRAIYPAAMELTRSFEGVVPEQILA